MVRQLLTREPYSLVLVRSQASRNEGRVRPSTAALSGHFPKNVAWVEVPCSPTEVAKEH